MRILGLDGGIASIGWAVVDVDEAGACGTIVAAGVWTFDAPETAKERTPTTAVRRLHRGQRRVISRRRQRMNAVRALFAEHGLLPDAAKHALKIAGLDPWRLRVDALDRALTGPELAVALGSIARHRGFRSNSKRDRGANAADETSKMLTAIEATRERLGAWRTVAEAFVRDQGFEGRHRNRRGSFDRSVLRDDLALEAATILSCQRAFGNILATAAFEGAFESIAFTQRPLQDSDDKVGPCPFEPGERRTARHSPSFERFRYLSRLAHLRLVTRSGERPLTPQEFAAAASSFGTQKKISFKTLRKLVDVDPAIRFAGIPADGEGHDVVARTGDSAPGTFALRGVLGETGWRRLLATPEKLDRIAEILTFREDLDRIREGLAAIGLEAPILGALMNATDAFARFKGAAHISAKAARAILPHLARGLVYSDACAEAGYDHTARAALDLNSIANPVARKALGEMLKQVREVVRRHGPIDRMHVELARDVGKSAEERGEISRGIEKRNREKDRLRAELRDLLRREPIGDELLRYELWKEQGGRCLYSDVEIPLRAVAASDNSVQVDHILPWSRFGDDSFWNKTLCTAFANQAKKGRTPWEWCSAEKPPEEWDRFVAAVEGCKSMRGRKKAGFYLRKNAAEVENKFRSRNLGDTRFATRLLLQELRKHYYPQDDGKEDSTRHVLARPGALTAKLRQAWGLEGWKKDAEGNRIDDDRHHALDAIVIAATTDSMVIRLTRAAQTAERTGDRWTFRGVTEPWPEFRHQVVEAVERVYVARAERRRARGEAHKATIKQVRERDGKTVVYERKDIQKLSEKDLSRIKDADRNQAVVEALRAWISAGKPGDALPRSPKGDVVRKVRLSTSDAVAVNVRGGTADRGDMARVDVFRREVKPGVWRYFLVPIYPSDIVGKEAPPNRAVTAHKLPAEWPLIDDTYEYLWPIYLHSYISVVRATGEYLEGYNKGVDVGSGNLAIASHQSLSSPVGGIGARTLRDFRKFVIDRLGERHEIARETRTWHGRACT